MPTIHHGDCIETMNAMPPESVDAIVTDPPYGLGFMGRKWDDLPPSLEWAEACYRVLKPGGHIAAFGGTRTWHRLAVAIEDAGFEMRDSLAWLYGSGFPKSHDVSKAIDKRPGATQHPEFGAALRAAMTAKGYTNTFDVAEAVLGKRTGAVANWIKYQFPEARWWPALRDLLDMDEARWGPVIAEAEREVVGRAAWSNSANHFVPGEDHSQRVQLDITAPATPEAERWQGWGTALKPAHEPVVLAMKPLDNAALFARIGSQLEALEEACRQRASGAARSSAPTPAASHAGRAATAHDNAATPHEDGHGRTTPTGAAAGSSAQTATSASALTVETFLSTVTSWKACLAEISEATSTSTTSTATRPTTDLQTLSSCLSSIMQSVTAQSTPDPRSWSSLASAADNLFAAGVLSSRSTLALSAAESATASTPPAPQGGAEGSPAFEPIVLARKPLGEKTVARNVLAHGTGAINIDGCRIAGDMSGGTWGAKQTTSIGFHGGTEGSEYRTQQNPSGRWPANVVLDQHAAAWVDEQSGDIKGRVGMKQNGVGSFSLHGFSTLAELEASAAIGGTCPDGRDARTTLARYRTNKAQADETAGTEDQGGASRFFYTAKAPKRERPNVGGVQHPTVKPLAIMRWLIRLVTPPGGVVLDPFAGSGTTIEAALIEGFNPVGIEMEPDYLPLIQHRIDRQASQLAV